MKTRAEWNRLLGYPLRTKKAMDRIWWFTRVTEEEFMSLLNPSTRDNSGED